METLVLCLVIFSLLLTASTNNTHTCEPPYRDLLKHPGWWDSSLTIRGANYLLTRGKTSYILEMNGGNKARLRIAGLMGKTVAVWTRTEGWRFV